MKTIDSNKSKLKVTYTSILIPLAVAINLIGGQIALQLKLPLYLDAIGTVILSAIMGPWIGAISGLLSSFITSLIMWKPAGYALWPVQCRYGAHHWLYGARWTL